MNTQDSISDKRRLTECDDSGIDAVTRDTDVWLPDGNIVVIARNTGFRVHKSILAIHSEVFRDLFLLPPSAAEEETLDGCPVVWVSDDPTHLRRLFLVLCCGKNFYYYENDELIPVQFDVLYSLINMGHKYAIPSILNDALSRLKKYYPSDLSAWENYPQRARYVTIRPPDFLLAVQVARLTNTFSILPSAYLEMSRHAEQLVMMLPEFHDGQLGLTAEIITQALRGKAALIEGVTSRILAISTAVPAPQCPTQSQCALLAHGLLGRLNVSGEIETKLSCEVALQPLYDWFWGVAANALCACCQEASRRVDEEMRQRVWKTLPQHFRLEVDGWPV
ncbi:hypothetical protein BD309DRAFT_957268 [Dichomitus squalens]|nr:hypothetical protein BD309DRAFT_957268 [Dichomitus squalens]